MVFLKVDSTEQSYDDEKVKTHSIIQSLSDDENEQKYDNSSQEESKKKQASTSSKFSKSFETSIVDLDNLIDHVDNNIKLKRNLSSLSPEPVPQSQDSNSIYGKAITITLCKILDFCK